MKLIRRTGAWLLVAACLLFFPCGGMTIKRDAEGTWLNIGPLQWIGAAVLLLGILLTLVGAFAGKEPKIPEAATKETSV